MAASEAFSAFLRATRSVSVFGTPCAAVASSGALAAGPQIQSNPYRTYKGIIMKTFVKLLLLVSTLGGCADSQPQGDGDDETASDVTASKSNILGEVASIHVLGSMGFMDQYIRTLGSPDRVAAALSALKLSKSSPKPAKSDHRCTDYDRDKAGAMQLTFFGANGDKLADGTFENDGTFCINADHLDDYYTAKANIDGLKAAIDRTPTVQDFLWGDPGKLTTYQSVRGPENRVTSKKDIRAAVNAIRTFVPMKERDLPEPMRRLLDPLYNDPAMIFEMPSAENTFVKFQNNETHTGIVKGILRNGEDFGTVEIDLTKIFASGVFK